MHDSDYVHVLMKAGVTITLDPEIHCLAKQTARKKHTTVSGLIETLLQSEISTKDNDRVARLRDFPTGADPLHDSLTAKYIL